MNWLEPLLWLAAIAITIFALSWAADDWRTDGKDKK